jgi:hypothetical protein
MGSLHGKCGTPIYKTWQNMIARCQNPLHPIYDNYGGRGITVCERWKTFVNFFADMGERPDSKSLDRIDNEKGYFPDNCRWATKQEQDLNRRPTYVKGKSQRQLAKELGVRVKVVKILQMTGKLPKLVKIR